MNTVLKWGLILGASAYAIPKLLDLAAENPDKLKAAAKKAREARERAIEAAKEGAKKGVAFAKKKAGLKGLGSAKAKATAEQFQRYYEKTVGKSPGAMPPDCAYASVACAIALEKKGHKVEVVRGIAIDPWTRERDTHFWLEVDGKRFDPKNVILKNWYGTRSGYRSYMEEARLKRSEWATASKADVAKAAASLKGLGGKGKSSEDVLALLPAKYRGCKIDPRALRRGIVAETKEHRDVTRGSVKQAAKIAAAHLCEDPNAY